MSNALQEIASGEPEWAALTDSDHRLLSNEQRRAAIQELVARSTPVDLETLSAAVAERLSADELSSDEPADRVAIALHHVHLPKLAEAGMVDYDPEAHRVD